MSKKKILILLEHLRVEHTISHRDGTTTIDFLGTKMGALLKQKMRSIGLTPKDFDLEYIYGKIPEPKSIDSRTQQPTSYKDIPIKEFSQEYPRLNEKIVTEEYDIVIPTGRMGCKYLLDQVSITKLRGIPERKEITLEDTNQSHEFWVFPMFSMEYIDFKRNAEISYDGDLVQLDDFIKNGDTAFLPTEVEYEYTEDIARIREIFARVRDEKMLTSWDIETNTLRPDMEGAKMIVFSIAHKEKQGVTFPVDHKEHTWTEEEREEIIELIKEYVANKETYKVGQNIGFDIRFLMRAYGMTDFHNHLDTKVAYYLTVSQEEAKSFTLSTLAYEMTDMGGYDKPLDEWRENYIKEYRAEHKEKPVNEVDGSDFNYEWFPLRDFLAPYAAGDVDATLRIHNVLAKNIAQTEAWTDLYYRFYPRLTVALASIEAWGFQADPEYFDVLDEEYNKERDRILEAIRKEPAVEQLEEESRMLYEEGLKEWAKPKAERDEEIAKLRDRYKNKMEFNPNSPNDKKRVLFDIIGAQPPANKDTLVDSATNKSESEITWEDYKTDKNMMKWIKENIPEAVTLADLLLEYSSVSTLLSTFVNGLRKQINPHTNTIHGGYNPTGTSTSRLSSSRPNMQNLASSHQNVDKFDYHYPIKRLFTTRFDGGVILQADYSALEMRILGLRANDPGMTEAFLQGKDIHKNTASIMQGKPEEEISSDERQAAKAVAFGLVYGKQSFSLAGDLGVTPDEAEVLVNKFFAGKPAVRGFIEYAHEFLEKNGYVETMNGHRRIIHDVWGNKASKNEALRQSVNTIIQGTGAYLTNYSVALIYEYLKEYNKKSMLVATVHDSIVVDVHPDEIEEVTQVVKYLMENVPAEFLYTTVNGQRVRYPIEADVEIGHNYNDLVDYEEEDFKTFNSPTGYIKYRRDIKLLIDHKESGKITEEQLEEAIQIIENQKAHYQHM